ncbi:MAG TPA: PEP-CTERM sorting domain-containing protein, partial [Tepidisphaeraceae bacterium]
PNANIVTPSQADAAHPFAAPIAADFQNFQVQSVEAPNVVTNPAADTSYLPNVVNSEDGIANNLAAYEAQAVAARSFFYFTQDPANQPAPGGAPATLQTQGYIINSQLNQVYAQTGGAATATANGATSLEEQAVQMTDGIVLETGTSNTITSGDHLIDGFFVAGAVPTTANTPFGNATGNSDPTGTQPDVTYNRGLTGSAVHATPLGDSRNPADHGALSQNGINFLGTHADPGTGDAFNYADMLRYFYGADIHMTVVTPSGPATEIQHAVSVESFASDNGFFGNGKTNSSANVGVTSANITHSSTSVVNTPIVGSQVLAVHATGAFNYNDLSGLGPNSIQTDAGTQSAAVNLLGDAAVNLNMPSIGTITYWVKVDSGVGGATSLVLNDDSTGLTHTSIPVTILPANGWQEITVPIATVAGLSGGLGADFSINSINFTGVGDETFELGAVQFNETGVPEPTALAMLSSMALFAVRRRRSV